MWKSLKESFESPDSYVSLALGLAVVMVIGLIAFNYVKSSSQQSDKKSTESQQENKGSLPMRYTVKQGDTLWSISQELYKTGFKWKDIQNANTLSNPDVIEVGQTLLIPESKTTTLPTGEVSSASIELKSQKRQYTIKPGDSLWSIASSEYANAYAWTQIAKENALRNPDLIYAGDTLMLP